MSIRIAAMLDAERIAEIHATSWRNNYHTVLSKHYLDDVVAQERLALWKQRLNNPRENQQVFVVEEDDEVVGFTCVYADGNPDWGSYLDNLHVQAAYQGRGFGRSLVYRAANWCSQRAADKGLCLLVNQDNTRAQKFYLALGARNARPNVWNAPDGSRVPTYWFVWDNLDALVDKL